MFATRKPRDVVVVALDLHRFDSDYDSYKFLSAEDKFAHILLHVKAACQRLKEIEPNAAWVIAWREYGITESGEHGRSVTSEFKNKFKQELQKVTSEYRNLTIIGGTLSIKKEISAERLARIASYYAEHDELVKIEMSDNKYQKSMQYKNHLDQHAAVMEEMDKLVNQQKPVISVRNTCYIVQGGDEKSIMRHSKVAPFNELNFNDFPDLQNVIFQPGHGRSKPHTFPIMSEVGLGCGELPLMVVEICREHDLGAARIHRDGANRKQPSLLHFVLSDSIILSKDQIQAGYFLQLDSTIRPRLIKTSLYHEEMPDVKMYYCNALKEKFNLTSAIEPYVLFEDKVLHELNHMRSVAIGKHKQELLKNIRDSFIFQTKSILSWPLYICLENYFTNPSIRKRLLNPDSDTSDSVVVGFFKTLPERTKLLSSINKIMDLVEEQKDLHPEQKDYMSRRPPNKF